MAFMDIKWREVTCLKIIRWKNYPNWLFVHKVSLVKFISHDLSLNLPIVLLGTLWCKAPSALGPELESKKVYKEGTEEEGTVLEEDANHRKGLRPEQ
jgi:hypothetical protein